MRSKKYLGNGGNIRLVWQVAWGGGPRREQPALDNIEFKKVYASL
jgi:hypothetical protein